MSGIAGRALGRLVPSTSALFVCDIQDRFRSTIKGFPTVVDTARRTIRGAEALGMPIVVTEQYPRALGHTVVELVEVLPPVFTLTPYPSTSAGVPSKPAVPLSASHHQTFSKTLFSMYTPEVADHMDKHMAEVKQVLLLGIEAHVCVLQTALDLLDKGYEVHLLVDGVSSQREADRAVAIQRMVQAGVLLSTSEMALFQLAKDAKAPVFKAISALAKEERAPPCVPLTSSL